MTKGKAWNLIERIMIRRIQKANTALEAVAELEINTDELLAQMIEDREALRVMREIMAKEPHNE